MRSYWTKVGPKLMTGVLIRGGGDTERDTQRGRPCEDGGRDWSDAATS